MGWKNVKEHYRIGHTVCIYEADGTGKVAKELRRRMAEEEKQQVSIAPAPTP